MIPWTVRPAATADAEELARLASELGRDVSVEDAERHVGTLNDRHALLVAPGTRDDGLAGWLEVVLEDNLGTPAQALVTGLVVDAPARRTGVARALLDAASSWASEHGARLLRVRARVERTEAAATYRRTGFRLEKTQRVFTRRRLAALQRPD